MRFLIRIMKKTFLIFISIIVLIPIYMIIVGSFMDKSEINISFGSVLGNGMKNVSFPILPSYITGKSYKELLVYTPEFFKMFWNSCIQVIPTILGQILVGAPISWALSRYNFRGKWLIASLYIILMVMPFQVTMVSHYLVLNRFHLLNTPYAIILPGIFSTFPVFIMTRFFKTIHEETLEAARIDGAGEWTIFMRIGIPLGNAGIMSVLVLSFLEYFNAIEQPLTFLSDRSLWPLSLYLPNITQSAAGESLVASVIMIIPAFLVFLFGQSFLEQGISNIIRNHP